MPELHKNDAEPIIITKGHTLLEKLFCADASQQKTHLTGILLLALLDYAITLTLFENYSKSRIFGTFHQFLSYYK